MEKFDIKKRIQEEDDYIKCIKFNNSINKLLSQFSDGIENSGIAKYLMISEEEVEKIYQEAVEMLKRDMEKNG